MPKSVKKGSKAKKESLPTLLTDTSSLAKFSVQVNQLIQNFLGARCLVLGVRETRSVGHDVSSCRLWVRYFSGLEAPLETSFPADGLKHAQCSAVEQVQTELTRLRQSYKELKPFKITRSPKAKGASKPIKGASGNGKAKAAGKSKKGK